jgi:hypothetical protein
MKGRIANHQSDQRKNRCKTVKVPNFQNERHFKRCCNSTTIRLQEQQRVTVDGPPLKSLQPDSSKKADEHGDPSPYQALTSA